MDGWSSAQRRIVTLVLPVVAWDLGLQLYRVLDRFPAITRDTGTMGSLDWLGLFSSPLLFHCGLSLVCAGLVFAGDGKKRGWALFAAAQAVALLAFLLESVAFAYFMHTSSPLDFGHLSYWIGRPGDLVTVAGVLAIPGAVLAVLGAAAVVSLPWFAGRFGPPHSRVAVHPSVLVFAGAAICCIGFVPPTAHAADASSVRDPVLELAASALDDPTPQSAPAQALRTLQVAGKPPPLNVVIVLLESTRAFSVAPWGQGAPMPFLESLVPKSLVIERAYTTMPHTAKALIGVLCGLEPAHTLDPMAMRTGLLDRCLPELLAEKGYSTVFFQSANPLFEDRKRVVRKMDYATMLASDSFDLEGYEKANFVGYEDEVMLPSSLDWLKAHLDVPFLATYLTAAPHHECWPLKRHGRLELSGEPALNDYLNNVRSEDFFLKGLVAQYRELGLLDRTVFVILGDHGEAFDEHGRRAHDVVPYDEVLRIPMLFWDPSGTRFKPGRLPGPASALDVMPTVLQALDLTVSKGTLPGRSVFRRGGGDAVYSACYANRECLARMGSRYKLIHWFDKRPDELYDLQADPREQNDLAKKMPKETAERRADLLRWDARVRALYWGEGLFTERRR